MTTASTSPRFKENAREALTDPELQTALSFVEVNFIARRQEVADKLPEFEALRDSARDIKNHTLAHLDLYLEAYEKRVLAQGGHVHYALTADDACRIALEICRKLDAKTVTKGKSMIGEEIGINAFLEANGVVPVETDLGEYIIQIRGELPSHIIAPAVHLTKAQVEADFRRVHTHLPADRNMVEPETMLAEADDDLAAAIEEAREEAESAWKELKEQLDSQLDKLARAAIDGSTDLRVINEIRKAFEL